MDLMQFAAWSPHALSLPQGEAVQVMPGETRPLSIRFLMVRWGWGSKKRVERFIGLLIERGQLRRGRRTQNGDTYHIVNAGFAISSGDSNGYTDGYSGGDSNGYTDGYKLEEGEEEKEGKEEKDQVGTDVPLSISSQPKSSFGGLSEKQSVLEVFEYWREKSGHEKATLTDERRVKINSRLKRYSVEDLKRAIDGACSNPFFAGSNDQAQRYDWPETIFRTDSTAEKHMSYGGPPPSSESEMSPYAASVWAEVERQEREWEIQ